ncbi:MAG: dephospho-CoA kinase [Candidatus Sedimenticola sp. 20ELBAFRAG]
MLTVGLTGGIGSGKSAVTRLFEDLGVPVIDADQASREVVKPGQPALQQLAQRFGDQIIDSRGQLLRKALREIVFTDEQARKDLETILHPLIRQRIDQQLGELSDPYAVLAIPLLIETGASYQVDRILVVDCSVSEQVRRVSNRDGVSEAQVEAILATQASREQRLKAADDVIENSGTIEELKPRVAALHQKYLELAERASPQ